MDIETAGQKLEDVHNAPKTFHANVLDHGLSYNPKEGNASLSYVSLEEWKRLTQDRRRRDLYRAMAELTIYSPQDIEALEGHEYEENHEMRTAITWMLIYIIILLFLNALGFSSVFELFF